MKEGESLTEHLKRMKELTDQLGAIGAVTEEEDQIVTLLGSLPSSYATIVTALETKMNDLTLQFVQQALINEEQKRVQTDDNSGGATSGGASCQHKFAEICSLILRQWELTDIKHDCPRRKGKIKSTRPKARCVKIQKTRLRVLLWFKRLIGMRCHIRLSG